MKKILFLLKHLSLGGAEKMFLRILKCINRNIYNIHVVLVFDERLQELSDLPDLKVTSIFKEKNDSAKLLLKNHPSKIYAENITDTYDVEIAFLEGYPTQIIATSPNPNSLKIAFIHTDFRFFHHSLNAYSHSDAEAACYQKYTCLIFVSEAARNGFHTIYPFVLTKKEYVFYPPITEEMLLTSQKQIINLQEKPYFITLTRLAPEKGIFKLINAYKKIREFGYDICLKIYGTGPLYNKLLQKIQSEHLEKYIHLMGYSPAPYSELKNSLAYICPSDNESFCIAIEEALFLSVPIIACRCSGTEEILHNGDFGLLVNNNSEGLANGICQFITSPDLQQILAQKSLNGKKYWEKILQKNYIFFDFYHTRKSK